MIAEIILSPWERSSQVVRRTVTLPESVDDLVRESAEEGESFSAAVTRLLEAGLRASRPGRRPSYAAAGSGPRDLGRMAEEYLRKLVTSE
jgi:hypothetical protein